MNNFRDTRLIEAFEYIDPKYINEVGAGLKLRSVYSAEKEHSKPTLRTHVKQLATLAACVLLLSLAIPLFSYVGNLIADFAAGHAGTTEDLPYLVYSPDVEPLSQELMDEMNEKFIQCFLKMSKEELIAEFGENYVEELDHLWLFGYWDSSCTAYYGTFGDCIVVAQVNSPYGDSTINIAGYKIITHTYVYHCPTKTMYQIDAAYAMGLLNNDDIELISDRHNKCMQQGREDKTTDATRSGMTEDVSDVTESTEPSQTSNPNFQYSTVRIISDNNAFINPISVKFGYSLYKDDKSIWTEEIPGWQYIISNSDYKFENLPILTLDGDISSSAPENVSISNFQIYNSDWERLYYTFVNLYELSFLPAGDYIVVGIEKEMIPYEQPHYMVGEYDYKLESSAAVFALSVTEQIYTNTDTGDPDSDLPTGIRVWDWYHPDDSERYPYFSVSLPEFNNVTIEREPKDGNIYVDGVHLLGGVGYGCSSFYLSDLTGDGYPELCFVMNAGSGIVDHRIEIIDYTTKETVFTAIGRMYRDYYLFLRNGVLCVKETEYLKQEAIRTGVLKHNGSEITIIWDSEVNATVDRDPIPQPGEPVS